MTPFTCPGIRVGRRIGTVNAAMGQKQTWRGLQGVVMLAAHPSSIAVAATLAGLSTVAFRRPQTVRGRPSPVGVLRPESCRWSPGDAQLIRPSFAASAGTEGTRDGWNSSRVTLEACRHRQAREVATPSP